MAFRLLRVVETSPQSILEPSPHPQPVGSTVDLSVVDILSKRGHTLCGAGAQPPSHTARVGAVVTCQQFVPSPVPPSPPAQTDPVVFVRHPLVGAGWSGALDPLMLRFGAGGGPGGCGGWAGNAPRALSPVSQRRLSWPWLCRGGWLRKGGPEAEPRGGVPGALALSLGDRSDPDGVPLLPHAHRLSPPGAPGRHCGPPLSPTRPPAHARGLAPTRYIPPGYLVVPRDTVSTG